MPVSSLVKNLSWYGQDLTGPERDAADALNLLVEIDETIANRVASRTWLVDGVTHDEAQAVVQVQRLAAIDSEAASEIAVLPWFDDGIEEQEWRAVQHVYTVVKHGPLLFQAFKRRSWFHDDISVAEEERLGNFVKVIDPQGDGTGTGVSVASKIVKLGWFNSEIVGTYDNQLLSELSALLAQNLALGARVAGMPFMAESIESHDIGLLRTLYELRGEDLESLTSQGWFEDGIDDDEAIVVTILPSQVNRSPENFRRLLNANFIDKGSAVLSLAGEVNFAIVRLGSVGNGDVMPHLINAAAKVEEFMGLPQPIDEVILLIGAPGGERELSGVNLGGTFIVVRPEDYECCVENETVFAHELVHFYPANRGRVTPPWFREGGADYIAFWVHQQLYNLSFSYVGDPCPAVSVQQLLDEEAAVGPAQHQAGPLFVCNYITGQQLLKAVSEAMGTAAFRDAWQEIQRTAAAGLPPADAKIYEIFRSHTPSSRLTLFEAAYAIWHTGDFD
ncbi:MAG: hypothetical protein IH872_13880 [Chloroflexi bacterium]|nr:hypothetical protein [Chloroflexota bacterium]